MTIRHNYLGCIIIMERLCITDKVTDSSLLFSNCKKIKAWLLEMYFPSSRLEVSSSGLFPCAHLYGEELIFFSQFFEAIGCERYLFPFPDLAQPCVLVSQRKLWLWWRKGAQGRHEILSWPIFALFCGTVNPKFATSCTRLVPRKNKHACWTCEADKSNLKRYRKLKTPSNFLS